MKRRKNRTSARIALGTLLMALPAVTCGGGVAVRLRIDEFTMEVDVDAMVGDALAELKSSGMLPEETESLPEKWPDNLPDVTYSTLFAAPPVVVDLTPDDPKEAKKYAAISAAEGAINRIDLNRLVLRVEASSLTVALPELRLQIADSKDADADDRLAWRTVGVIPGADPGFVGDLEFEFRPGGESFMRYQLADKLKEFSLRVLGNLKIDTAVNDRLPAGKAVVRLIVVATFFVDPAGAIGAADRI